MAQLCIPEIEDRVMERLERRAKRHGRDIEAEARAILGASTDDAAFARG
jgi:plasmid stability protein